jgi:8-oxo-dGTP diphosphatase
MGKNLVGAIIPFVLCCGEMKTIPVTCALIVQNGKLLCAQRSETMALPLKWELPGGKIEPNESEEDCLRREILEELGLIVQVENRLDPNLHEIQPGKQIQLIPFMCKIIGGTLHPTEHKAIEWLEFTELLQLDWAEADVPIIKQFIQSTL